MAAYRRVSELTFLLLYFLLSSWKHVFVSTFISLSFSLVNVFIILSYLLHLSCWAYVEQNPTMTIDHQQQCISSFGWNGFKIITITNITIVTVTWVKLLIFWLNWARFRTGSMAGTPTTVRRSLKIMNMMSTHMIVRWVMIWWFYGCVMMGYDWIIVHRSK